MPEMTDDPMIDEMIGRIQSEIPGVIDIEVVDWATGELRRSVSSLDSREIDLVKSQCIQVLIEARQCLEMMGLASESVLEIVSKAGGNIYVLKMVRNKELLLSLLMDDGMTNLAWARQMLSELA